jgi:hypothetical protein
MIFLDNRELRWVPAARRTHPTELRDTSIWSFGSRSIDRLNNWRLPAEETEWPRQTTQLAPQASVRRSIIVVFEGFWGDHDTNQPAGLSKRTSNLWRVPSPFGARLA